MQTKNHPARHALSALALSALALTGGHAVAAEYWMQAAVTTITLPDPSGVPGATVTVPMWGYALCTPAFASCAAPTFPGPALSVPEADTSLVVNLKNALATPTSLVVNGLIKPMVPVWSDGTTGNRTSPAQRVRSFDAEAAPGGTQVYTWANVKPGTYLYQSGTQPQVQVQMGLYGAVSKNFKDATASTRALAYDTATPYDNQVTLLYSEIDPVLHAAIATGTYGTTGPTSTFDYQPKYFLVNGAPYRGGVTPAVVPAQTINTAVGATSNTLLRVLNAGLTTHVPSIQGKYWDVVAEDGKRYPFKRTQYTALLPAAKTLDLLLTPDTGGGVYPIMDRRLSLSNAGVADGGMMVFLQYGGSGVVGATPGDPNLPPVANADSYSGIYGVELSVGVASGVLFNDTDTDGPNPLRVVAATGPTTAGGSYALNANGSFTYTPPASGGGTDTFSYQVTDGKAISSATVTFNLGTPAAPVLGTPLDDFNRPDGSSLGTSWSQATSTTASPNVVVLGTTASATSTDLGGQAIWSQGSGGAIDPSIFGESQYAAFTSVGSLQNSGLILKASGGTAAAPANFVRVRVEDSSVVIATMVNGGSTPVYFKQAAFPATATSGTLSAAVDAKGMVTVFINGAYVGGVQLPDVGAWKGKGRVGIQLQTLNAAVDNFAGGTTP